MLVFIGIKLIFYIAISMRLCFGFVLESVSITQGCSCYCWTGFPQHQGLFCLSFPLSAKRLGGAQAAQKGTHSWSCKWEVVNKFLVLLCLHAWLLLCFFSQPMSFPTLTLLFLSPILLCGEWASSCIELSSQLGLNHYNILFDSGSDKLNLLNNITFKNTITNNYGYKVQYKIN